MNANPAQTTRTRRILRKTITPTITPKAGRTTTRPRSPRPAATLEVETDFIPLGDRVLVERLPIAPELVSTTAHNEREGLEAIVVEGIVLRVGPGKTDDDGYIVPMAVSPGDRVMFNARWNDFCHGELKGTDCDGKGPLERPVPQSLWKKKRIYLITEGDIAGVLSNATV